MWAGVLVIGWGLWLLRGQMNSGETEARPEQEDAVFTE